MIDEMRVLAVDDDPALLRVIERVLTNQGHEVHCAATGTEALNAARSQRFEMAVIDYEIPAPNGIEVLVALRQLQPGCVTVLASGALDVPAVSGAINRGDVSRVLAKPYHAETLIDTLRDAVFARRRIAQEYQVACSEEWQVKRQALEQCFQERLLQLALQPIKRARSGELFGYEALLRSRHPSLKSPLEVIATAERHSLIHFLGGEVIRLAAERLATIPDHVRLFINVHPEELADPPSLVARMGLLADQAKRVCLEITEQCQILDVKAWDESKGLLTDMGFSLAVDDVGAGYNSLAVLAHIRPSFLKIDMSLIRHIDQQPTKRRLVELLCQFGRASDALVIAEGIETDAEASVIEEIGADLLQGYLFGKPTV